MLLHTSQQDALAQIQLSMARAAAARKNPSLKKLYDDIIEEFGCKPGDELVDYFAEIAKIPLTDVVHYFHKTGSTCPNTTGEQTMTDESSLLARSIAGGCNPTVLHFRKAYIGRFNEAPPEKLIDYFLNQINKKTAGTDTLKSNDNMLAFTRYLAACSNPTVLFFRSKFTKKFGFPPSAELTEYFLEQMESDTCHNGDEEHQSQIHFAEAAAAPRPTILQFRKKFEQAYGEPPSSEILEIFLGNFPPPTESTPAIDQTSPNQQTAAHIF